MQRVGLALATAALLGAGTVQADPVGDFFKRLGRSMSNNGKRTSTKQTASGKTSGSKKPGDQATSEGDEGASPSPAASPKFSSTARAASAVPDSRNSKRDAPFGIPVPGKKGFVTSPYLPDGNYVDVRAFAPGTEVKDPYTGKIFRVP